MYRKLFVGYPLVGFLFLACLVGGPSVVANSRDLIEQLNDHLKSSKQPVQSIAQQPFADQRLTKSESAQARRMIVAAWKKSQHQSRLAEINSGELTFERFKLPIAVKKFGQKPADGWSLYISMHGGGSAPKRLNDQQWDNQQRLYQPQEGIYVAPRAPTDTWNLWHQAHIDWLFDRLISNLIVTEGVNPDRVYLLGYSAGGDGVYQLAPRMADRFAAAAMMAGHPNETSPLGLRNLPFSIQVGAKDTGFDRNKEAVRWRDQLKQLQQQDPDGYVHDVKLHQGLGHWMQRRDAVAIDWMAQQTRDRFPRRVVWKQDDVTHQRFYWLGIDQKPKTERALTVVSRNRQKITVEKSDLSSMVIFLNDEMLSMDQDITVFWGQQQVLQQPVDRTIGNLAASLLQRGDPQMMFGGRVTIQRP